MAQKKYTAKDYYKVSRVHFVFFVLGIVFASLGYHFTQDRVEIHVTKNETAEGKEGQMSIPYWVTGYALGGSNFLLILLSYGVYRHVTKGTYTEERKKTAKDLDGMYRLLLMPASLWGVVGAVFTGVVGICAYESDETCYYVDTHFAANKAFAIILLAAHAMWFFIALELCTATKGVENQIGTIRVGTNLEASTPAPSQSNNRPRITLAVASPPNQLQPPSRQVRGTPKPPLPPLKTPTAPPKPASDRLAGGIGLPSVAPPSYDEATTGPYSIAYPPEPMPYSQPQNLYSGSAFPDGTPTVAHANR